MTGSADEPCGYADTALPYGVLDAADIAAFRQSLAAAGDPSATPEAVAAADANGDSVVDVFDLLLYLRSFDAGCNPTVLFVENAGDLFREDRVTASSLLATNEPVPQLSGVGEDVTIVGYQDAPLPFLRITEIASFAPGEIPGTEETGEAAYFISKDVGYAAVSVEDPAGDITHAVALFVETFIWVGDELFGRTLETTGLMTFLRLERNVRYIR